MAYNDKSPDFYEIENVFGNTRCLMAPLLIPFYMTDASHCILMDTGTVQMREAIEKTFEKNGITPIGIFCTHTHYDHYGSAGYFSEKYQCPIALPLGEAEVSRTLSAVKSYLFCFSAGQIKADPQTAALPCVVDHVIRPDEDETLFRGVRFKVIHTPGHSIDHVSIITPDNVCYAGDALMCGRSLNNSKFPYAFDMAESLASMEKFRGLSFEAMILAHRGIVRGPYDALVDENLVVTRKAVQTVSKLIDRQMTVEEIIRKVQKEMGVQIRTSTKALEFERFFRPYLEYMIDTGTHRQSVREGILCYEPV